MKTPLKVVLACVALVVVVVAGILFYVMLAVDPNSYKAQLEEAARKQGVELEIAGDLGWSLWPDLAITVGETRFAGAQHGLEASSLQQASLVLSWGELLRKRIAVKALKLDGANLHLTSTDTGAAIAAAPATGEQPVETTAPDGQSFSLAVDALTIVNSRVRLDQDDGALAFNHINLSVSNVNVEGEPFPLAIAFQYQPEEGEPLAVDLSSDVSYAQQGQSLQLINTVLEVDGLSPETLRVTLQAAIDLATETASIDDLRITLGSTDLAGSAALGYGTARTLTLELKGSDLDLDTLSSQSTSGEETDGSHTPARDVEPGNLLAPLIAPLALLEGGEGKIQLALSSLVSDGLTLDKPVLRLSARGNTLTLEEISTGLFGGTLNSDGVINIGGATPTLRFSARLADINLAAALDHFAEDMDFTGTLAMNISGNTRGEDGDALLANLAASGDLAVTDPHLGNVNIEQSYCELAALVERSGARAEPWPRGTALNDLTSNFRIENQVLHLQNYSTGIGNLSLRGNGEVNIERQSFDIRAITRLNGERTSAAGCEVKSSRVRDKDIPFVCRDRFAEAGATSCQPDPDFVRGVLQKEVFDRLLGDDEDGEDSSLGDRLRGLFGR